MSHPVHRYDHVDSNQSVPARSGATPRNAGGQRPPVMPLRGCMASSLTPRASFGPLHPPRNRLGKKACQRLVILPVLARHHHLFCDPPQVPEYTPREPDSTCPSVPFGVKYRSPSRLFVAPAVIKKLLAASGSPPNRPAVHCSLFIVLSNSQNSDGVRILMPSYR